MTNEEKELLIKDLCARLPYDVEVRITFPDGSGCEEVFDARDLCVIEDSIYDETDKQYPLYLPYLRPMESMTEEEKAYQMKLIKDIKHGANIDKLEDFYHSHHFDYRGLIPMGFALPAPEDMYNN